MSDSQIEEISEVLTGSFPKTATSMPHLSSVHLSQEFFCCFAFRPSKTGKD